MYTHTHSLHVEQASRNWTELRSDANVAEAVLARQNCMVLSISATLELYDDAKAVSFGRDIEAHLAIFLHSCVSPRTDVSLLPIM